jgi:hypothetical protein
VEQLGDRVRRMIDRVYKGNVLRAAQDIGIGQPTLRAIVKGEVKHPRSNIVEKVARGLHCSTDWLLLGTGPDPLEQPLPDRAILPGADAPKARTFLAGYSHNAGSWAWRHVLQRLELSDDAYYAWLLVPMAQISEGTLGLVDIDVFLVGPEHNQKLAAFRHAHEGAYEFAHMAWAVQVDSIVQTFGADAVRSRMEKMRPLSENGFAGASRFTVDDLPDDAAVPEKAAAKPKRRRSKKAPHAA